MAAKNEKNADKNVKLNDISAIFSQLNNTTKSVTDLLNGLDTIATASMKFGMRKRMAVESAHSLINSYMDMIAEIISCISSAVDSKADKSLSEVLGYQETMKEVVEKSSNGELSEKITTDGKYPIIDFMAGFATMMSNLVDPLQKIASSPIFLIAGSKFGGFIEAGFTAYADMMGKLLEKVLNSFSNIDTSKLGDVVSLLVGDPETITKISNKTDNTSSNGDSKNNDTKDFSKEVSTGKKMGVLELITGLLGIIDTISHQMTINPVKKWIMKLRINTFSSYIKTVIDGVIKALPSDGVDDKKYESLNKTMSNLADIISTIHDLEAPGIGESIIMGIKFSLFREYVLSELQNTLIKIDEILSDSTISTLGEDNSTQDQTLNGLMTITNSTIGLIKLINSLSIIEIINASLILMSLPRTLELIKNIINKLSEMQLSEETTSQLLSTTKHVQNILNAVQEIVKSIGLVAAYIILGTVALSIAVFAMPMFIFGVIALALFIFTINKILGFITRVSPQISINIVALVTLIGGISLCFAIISLTFIVIALSFSIIIKHFGVLILGLGILMLFLVLFTAFSALIGAASPIILAGAITTAIVVGAMTITLIGLMTIALLLIALTYIADWMDPDNILAATDTVLGTALKVIEKIITADFGMRSKAAANTGLLGGLSRMIFGGQAATIIDLVEKIFILGLTIISIVALMILCTLLIGVVQMTNKIPWAGDVAKSVTKILNAAKVCIYAILNSDFSNGLNGDRANQDRGAIGWILDKIGGGQLDAIFDLILKVGIVVMTIISLGLLYMLATMIISFNEYIKENKDLLNEAPKKIKTLISTCYKIIGAVLNAKPANNGKTYSNKGLLSSLIGIVSPQLSNIVDLIFSAVTIATTMVTLGLVLLLAKEMKSVLSRIDKMNLQSAPDQISQFMESVNGVISAINNTSLNFGGENEAWYSKVAKANNLVGLAQVINKMGQIGLAHVLFGAIEKLVKSAHHTKVILDKYSKEPADMDKKMKNLLKSIQESAKGINGLSKDDNLTKIVNDVSKYQTVIKESDKLVNKVNGLNLAKMKAFAEMWKHAAAFSKSINGNFDKLADALTNKIAPLLDGLKNAIEQADKHIQESAQKAEKARKAAQQAQEVAEKNQENVSAAKPTPSTPSKPVATPVVKPTPKPSTKSQTIEEFFKLNGYIPIKTK